MLAHAALVLRQPWLWHPIRSASDWATRTRRVALLAVDVLPAAIAAPDHRTAHKLRFEDGAWGADEYEVRREWRNGRWGWLDVERDRWYHDIMAAGAATITAAAGGGAWTTGATWVGGVAPDATSDVLLTATSGAVTVSVSSLARSLDMTGYLSTLSGSGDLSIGDGSGGACTLAGTISGTWTTAFVSTSNNATVGWSITSNAKAFPGAVTFNGVGGKWLLADNFTCGANVLTVLAGGFFGNGKNVTASQIVSNVITNVRTVDITNCAVSCTAAGNGWAMAAGGTGNMTLTTTGSTITLSGAGASMTPGGGAYNTVVFSGSGTATLSGGASTSTFVNLTRTGTAVKTDVFTVSLTSGTFAVTGTLTVGGNTTQGVNRLLVNSNTVGTQRTIDCTGAAVVISGDVDFADIAITGAPSWTNTGSKFVGDMGGNGTLITTNRTTPATQTATGTASFTWSTHGWTSRVPLPQDTVLIPNAFIAGRTVTNDMQRMGGSVSFAGCTGSPAFTSSVGAYICGSLTLVAGMTTSGTTGVVLAGRSAHTITTAGVVWAMTLTVSCGAGSYTLADAFTSSRSAQSALNIATGTLVDAGFTVTLTGNAGTFVMTGGALTKTGAWVFQTTNALTFWNITGGTVSDTAGSITLTATSANTRTFTGGGQTYKTLTYTVAGSTGQLTISDSNTFGTVNFSDATNARTLVLPGSAATTISAVNGFNGVAGTAGKLMSVSSSAGTATLALTGGCTCRYVSLTGIAATPSGAAYALDSTDGGTNTGWVFSPPDDLLGRGRNRGRSVIGASPASQRAGSW